MKHNDTVKYSILIPTLASFELHALLCIFYEFNLTGFQRKILNEFKYIYIVFYNVTKYALKT